MFNFLRLIPRQVIIVAAFLLLGFYLGYSFSDTRAEAQIAKLKQDWQAQQLDAERHYQVTLAKADAIRTQWQQRANELDTKLMAQAQAAQQTETKLRQEIRNALAKDKNDDICRTGIGTHSLRLYNAALGYSEDGGSTGDAAGAGTATRAPYSPPAPR